MNEPMIIGPGEAPDIDSMPRVDAPAIWEDFRQQLTKLKTTAETLTVTSVEQKAEMKLARETRLALKGLRVEIEKNRKELGEEALRRKQRIDSSAKILRDVIEPLEARMLEMEQFAEREAQRRREALAQERAALLLPFGAAFPEEMLAEMDAAQFATCLDNAKAGFEARQAEAKRAEEERQRQERESANERLRLKMENLRMQEETKKERERMAAEAEKLRAENAARERAAAEVARQEREARQKVEAELAERKRKEAEEARAAAVAAQAPDREKLLALADRIAGIELPVMATPLGQRALEASQSEITSLAGYIRQNANQLK